MTEERQSVLLPESLPVMQWFVDRYSELARFRRMLEGEDKTRVWVVSGPKGIGKTWLLDRMRHEVAANLPVAWLGFSPAEAVDADRLVIIQRLTAQLDRSRFPGTEAAISELRLEIKLKREKDPEPGHVTIGGDIHTEGGDVAFGDLIKGNFYFHEDPQRLGAWRERVTQAFLADLQRLADEQPVIMFVDDYEHATVEARNFLEVALANRLAQGGLPGLRLLFAGQVQPALPSLLQGLVVDLKLGNLPAAEVRRYLLEKRARVLSEEVVAAIFEVTRGRPDLVGLIADCNRAAELPPTLSVADLQELLVDCIMDRAADPVRSLLRYACVPYWFDAALLADLQTDDEPGPDFLRATEAQVHELLTAYSFMAVLKGGQLAFPEHIRSLLLERSWTADSATLQQVHQRAANHFRRRSETAADRTLREEYERQALGHWLVVDELAGRSALLARFAEMEGAFQLAACERLLQRVSAIPGLSYETRAWIAYLNGWLAWRQNEDEASCDHLAPVVGDRGIPAELRHLAAWRLGQALGELGLWENARRHLRESADYFSAFGEAQAPLAGQILLSLGDVHLRQARALGGAVEPLAGSGRQWSRRVRMIPALFLVLPFVLYARLMRHWQLPPLHYSINYRNWTPVRLLFLARESYQQAEELFQGAALTLERAGVQQRLANVCQLLGWWEEAYRLYGTVLASPPIAQDAYRKARVRNALAEARLAAGKADAATSDLEENQRVFAVYGDKQSEAETQALLGEASLRRGKVDEGLGHLGRSLTTFTELGDHVSAGQVLGTLQRWRERGEMSRAQSETVEQLLAAVKTRIYFPRVPDRLATSLAAILLFVFLLIGMLLFLLPGLVEQAATVTGLVRAIVGTNLLLRLLLGLLILIWALAMLSGVLGLWLIRRGESRQLDLRQLDRFVTDGSGIRREDFSGREVEALRWEEIEAIVTTNRALWLKPLTMLSRTRLISAGKELEIPATIDWYSSLVSEIDRHLGQSVIRHRHDLSVMRSVAGALLLLAPLCLLLANALMWDLLGVPQSGSLAGALGTCLMAIGAAALLFGPCRWAVVHPLRLNQLLQPDAKTPWVAGALGLLAMGLVFGFGVWQPFFPLRNWIGVVVFPVGFVLTMVSALWIAAGRTWIDRFVKVGEPLYPAALRGLAVLIMVGCLLLAGRFVWQETAPYWHVFRTISFYYRDDHDRAVAEAGQALVINEDIADAYMFRALARTRQEQYETAIADLSLLIDSGHVVMANYNLYRARAYYGAGEVVAACADLDRALSARMWRLSGGLRQESLDLQEEWGCLP